MKQNANTPGTISLPDAEPTIKVEALQILLGVSQAHSARCKDEELRTYFRKLASQLHIEIGKTLEVQG